jgi:hypothetical protein
MSDLMLVLVVGIVMIGGVLYMSPTRQDWVERRKAAKSAK